MSKKRVNGAWVSDSPRIYNTSTDTITTLPKTIIGDGQPITSYTIKGNMSQSGTPTPSAPIYPTECGDKTANLLPLSDKTFTITAYSSNLTVTCSNGNLYFSGTVGEIPTSMTIWKTNFAFKLEAGTYYCNSPSPLGSGFGRYIKKYSDNTNLLAASDYTFTLSETTECYLSFYIYDKNLDTQIELMLNVGSSPLPYQPYGYKIPISCGGTTTNVYLGEVQSTRQIKKYEFTGNETFDVSGSGYIVNISDAIGVSLDVVADAICSHYQTQTYTDVYDGSKFGFAQRLGSTNNNHGFSFSKGDYATSQDFQAYLAQQYAAGTPVTVWYVLSTATTGTINEPIRKIGNYSDSVTGTGIPTTGTAETFDVDTTLKPSEVSLTYHGWHEHQDTVFSE